MVPGGPTLVFLLGAVIGVLGGLIGLGGGEFRLPVLVGLLGYAARQAVPLNLAVSLVTLAASLAIRARTLSLAPVAPHGVAAAGMLAGALVGAAAGPSVARRLSNERFVLTVLVLLLTIGAILIAEGLLPKTIPALLPAASPWQAAAGVGFGLGIGLVSSLLGVAGGELIIPTLVIAYGADVKAAGTASVMISLPVVLAGIAAWRRRGGFSSADALRTTVLPMGAGSVVGAAAGGVLVRYVPEGPIKVFLGLLLIVSALRGLRKGARPED
ncbi:MAG: sulfite exporter TauE/SafE family protein [Armatimonadota bacterium]|nr:sulfite exporter TauE/SafE family protein [Armatimonadota bacterium]MDR7422302.1 sulfite exporter TauE/SafE family protein [Armatimonadota bacterium]MDR7453747.1 sulfite exporter TauE/SafE family protein [Armatimonadota bacterium]MDR7456276.1 sulfite exporter TauE/SafE family protein [Armatimonadota bacterium]MDR7496272.1 sulfite exporter TauE/SafE family protein [Armatimonadota bacterium]